MTTIYGHTLDLPEPGVYLTADGDVAQVAILESSGHHLTVMHAGGAATTCFWRSDDWPVLTPARMVPEAEWVRVNSDRDVLAEERHKWRDRAEMRNAKLGILQAELSDAMDTLTELAPAESTLPDPLNEEQVGELWDKVKDSRVAYWNDFRTPLRSAIKRTVNAARAKHGHERQVTREQVLDAVEDAMTLAIHSGRRYQEPIVDAIMELLAASK